MSRMNMFLSTDCAVEADAFDEFSLEELDELYDEVGAIMISSFKRS